MNKHICTSARDAWSISIFLFIRNKMQCLFRSSGVFQVFYSVLHNKTNLIVLLIVCNF